MSDEDDIQLRGKQVFWETPKGILLIVATTATIIGILAGTLGYTLGSTPQIITVHLDAPLSSLLPKP